MEHLNPATDAIYIDSHYYDSTLSSDEMANLVETLAHESLHVYLDDQIGFANYLLDAGTLHHPGWLSNNAGAIYGYYKYGQPTGQPAPSITPIPSLSNTPLPNLGFH